MIAELRRSIAEEREGYEKKKRAIESKFKEMPISLETERNNSQLANGLKESLVAFNELQHHSKTIEGSVQDIANISQSALSNFETLKYRKINIEKVISTMTAFQEQARILPLLEQCIATENIAEANKHMRNYKSFEMNLLPSFNQLCMINLDKSQQKEKFFKRRSDKQNLTQNPINIKEVIASAQKSIKNTENKNYHLADQIRKELAKNLDPRGSTSNPLRKFDIERIYLQDNTHSQLKHLISGQQLEQQRDKIYNTYRYHKIEFRNGQQQNNSTAATATAGTLSQLASVQSQGTINNTKLEISTKKSPSMSKLKSISATPTSAFLTNVDFATNPLQSNSESNSKSVVLFTSPQKIKSQKLNLSSTMSQLQRQRINGGQNQERVSTQSGSQQISFKISSLQEKNPEILLPNNAHNNNNNRARSALIQNQRIVSSQPLTDRNYYGLTALNANEIHQEASTSPIESSIQYIDEHKKNPSELQQQQHFSPKNPSRLFNQTPRPIIHDDGIRAFSPDSQQPVYYIDNNEVQSVKEFMFRMKRYQTFKRFEQKRLMNERKQQQIDEVQKILMERSQIAAKDTAIANVRKFMMKNKINLNQEEIDLLVEQTLGTPTEVNQRLTYRETNRQIVSFQLKGTEEERAFSKIQKEIDKALNLINSPIKFLHQFAMHRNHKEKNYQHEIGQNQTSTVALINRLPQQYLANKPPPDFFNQKAMSSTKITSLRLIDEPKFIPVLSPVQK